MRILIILPSLPPASGNQVTARRYRNSLARAGHEVRLVTVSPENPGNLPAEVAAFRPDLVHLLHAFRAGGPWLSTASPLPFVVTLTGTDIHGGIDTPGEGPVIRRTLEKAARIIVQNPLTVADLARRFPELAAQVRFLPPGITLGTLPYPLRRWHAIPPDRFLFLHPAGIRPVKGNLELLFLFDELAASGHEFTMAFCGPVLDEVYGRQLLSAIENRPWARYLGIIPPESMPAALLEADVILNNSSSEGMPNAILEAAALGRPILAHDIPGNAAAVQEGYNGLLYRDAGEFARQAVTLLTCPDFRRSLSRPHPERYDPARERLELERIYREVLGDA